MNRLNRSKFKHSCSCFTCFSWFDLVLFHILVAAEKGPWSLCNSTLHSFHGSPGVESIAHRVILSQLRIDYKSCLGHISEISNIISGAGPEIVCNKKWTIETAFFLRWHYRCLPKVRASPECFQLSK